MTEAYNFESIRVLIFDVDGVFTDHQMLVTDDGQFLRTMSTRDGYAIKRAIEAGIQMAVITGGTSIGVEKRFRGLGIDIIHSGIHQKGVVFEALLKEEGWSPAEVLYIGDDIPDIECIEMAGIGACPKDSVPEVLAASDFISDKNGGDDCVRDLIERILGARGLW
ncbi:HAD hydrolase family protein [Membranicola marinus]|uniref:HAD hydrolase family protein n=1 Tax=Membranihabitans marinus TaxID=1227546 RepID=A0A953L651_9BACT|nr:HAD hydrolase family protein [Membranihabitans marinus]MBY5957282.1 HAD hydrolase family protein [Membranihabitans marinus]